MVSRFVDVIGRCLECSHQDVNRSVTTSLKSTVREKVNPKLRQFSYCIAEHGQSEQCMALVRHACQNSSILAAKTIRFRMYMAQELLLRDPEVKIIFYARDPRGIISSRLQRMKGTVKQEAEHLCKTMLDDYEWFLKLNKTHSESMSMYTYEDLAKNPQSSLQYLYGRLGLNLTDQIINNFQNKASANQYSGRFGTSRTNSSLTAIRWRKSLSAQMVRTINRVCRTVLSKYGFNK